MNVQFGIPRDPDYHGEPLGWHVYNTTKKRTIFLGANEQDCVEFGKRATANGVIGWLVVRGPKSVRH